MAQKSVRWSAALVALSGAATLANCSSHPSNANSSGAGGGTSTSTGAPTSTSAGTPTSTSHGTTSSGASTSTSSGTGGGPNDFQPDPPDVYVAKVKNILIGKAPTAAEITSVEQDKAPPAALRTLIGTWMQDPAYDAKMMVFFQNAFQQTQLTTASFVDSVLPNGLPNGPQTAMLIQNMAESFARTVIANNHNGVALNEAMSTNQLMMTGPLMEFYAYLDEVTWADSTLAKDPYSQDALLLDYPSPKLTGIYQGTAGYENITLAESLDPTSAHFLHFYSPLIATLDYTTGASPNPACNGAKGSGSVGNDPIEYPIVYPTKPTANANTPPSYILQQIIYGNVYNHQAGSAATGCGQLGAKCTANTDCCTQACGPTGTCASDNCGPKALANGSFWSDTDFGEGGWRLVTISQATAGQQTTRFFNVPAFQQTSTNTLLLRTPRIGFFGTPAFQANWSTNSSNQMRVTLNQSLIVATGNYIDGQDATQVPQAAGVNPPGLDAVHATGACANCHFLLDPARVVLQTAWSYPYSNQIDPTQQALKGQFVFQGVVNQSIHTVTDFGKALGSHPLMPQAWVQKLCYYVNSSPATSLNPRGGCDPNDPEFIRIWTAFQKNGLKWDAMVTDLLSSPLTTNAAHTRTTDEVQVVAVSRRDHVCAALNNRLFGGPAAAADICGLQVTSPGSTIKTIVGGFPADGYGRGSPVPVLPTQPTLFYRGGIETVCETVAAMVIDNKNALPTWTTWTSSATPTAAIADFVTLLMAIETNDARYAAAQQALLDHFNAVVATGASSSTALQSAFTVACMSPSFIGVGM